MTTKPIDFTKATVRALELIIVKPIMLPYQIWRSAIVNLSNADADDSEENNLANEFPLYIWLVSIFDALIALVYPVGFVLAIVAGANSPFRGFAIFMGALALTYFYPLFLGLVRELMQTTLKILLYLKVISKKDLT